MQESQDDFGYPFRLGVGSAGRPATVFPTCPYPVRTTRIGSSRAGPRLSKLGRSVSASLNTIERRIARGRQPPAQCSIGENWVRKRTGSCHGHEFPLRDSVRHGSSREQSAAKRGASFVFVGRSIARTGTRTRCVGERCPGSRRSQFGIASHASVRSGGDSTQHDRAGRVNHQPWPRGFAASEHDDSSRIATGHQRQWNGRRLHAQHSSCRIGFEPRDSRFGSPRSPRR